MIWMNFFPFLGEKEMAKAKVKQRKDDKGRVLQKGESQRKLDGMYIYTYVDPDLIRAQMDWIIM